MNAIDNADKKRRRRGMDGKVLVLLGRLFSWFPRLLVLVEESAMPSPFVCYCSLLYISYSSQLLLLLLLLYSVPTLIGKERVNR